jgi:nitrite reductase (NADH) large subunit
MHMGSNRKRLVVIGNGMAGARFIDELRRRDPDELFEIAVFGDEPYGNYNRILLSSVLAGAHEPADIFINPLAWYEDHNVRLHAGVPATRIDRAAQVVHGSGGVEESYDQLVIATGSSPVIPTIDGAVEADGRLGPGVFLFRTLDDCDAMLQQAESSRRAVVIGGGLLGLEAAYGLRQRGLEVRLIHRGKHLMGQQLDASSGDLLRRCIDRLGVHTLLNAQPTKIVRNPFLTGVALADGDEVAGDMVVIATGVRPRAELATAAGLRVERGVVVNDDLNTINDSSIFAIGECAEHRNQVYGLVAPLWEQARILAERLTGENPVASYRGSTVATKLKVMGVELDVMGDKESRLHDDEVVTYIEAKRDVYKKLIVRNDRLVGAILLNDGLSAPRLLQAFDRGERLPDNRSELLFALANGSSESNVADLDDSAQICNCNGVSKGAILEAVDGGCRSVRAVCDATRAGTGCGACKLAVTSLVESRLGSAIADDPTAHYYVPGVPLAKPELIAAISEQGLRSVSSVFAALAEDKDDPKSKAGLASLLKSIWGAEYEDERDARFINDRVHANIQNDGTFSVVPRIYGGVTTPDQLRRIADAADKHQVPMVKITGGQRIDLLGVPKEQLPAIWRELDMPSGHAYAKSFRTCKTCVGSEFCRYGVGDSTALGIAIERRFQGLETPHKVKMATAGCPRNCSEATTKDFGVVAIDGGKWEVYVGGGAGARVRKGDLLCVVKSHEEVLRIAGRFMQYYREHGKYLERTYDFVERLGVERIRSLLIDDVDGIGDRLDEDIQIALDAYVDPWEEATEPVHPAQFAGPAHAGQPEGTAS